MTLRSHSGGVIFSITSSLRPGLLSPDVQPDCSRNLQSTAAKQSESFTGSTATVLEPTTGSYFDVELFDSRAASAECAGGHLNTAPQAGACSISKRSTYGAFLYGRRPGQPSSSSLARRVCVQSLATSSFLSSSTSSLKYVNAPGSSHGAEGDGGTAPLAVAGPSVTQCVVSLLPVT